MTKMEHRLLTILGWLVVLAFAVGACRMVYGETLPDAPRPQKVDRIEWSLLAADAGVRALDVYSTHRMLSCRCNREVILPKFVADETPILIVYSAGIVAGQYLIARKLGRRHRAIARVFTLFDVAVTLGLGAHNLTLPVPVKGMRQLGK